MEPTKNGPTSRSRQMQWKVPEIVPLAVLANAIESTWNGPKSRSRQMLRNPPETVPLTVLGKRYGKYVKRSQKTFWANPTEPTKNGWPFGSKATEPVKAVSLAVLGQSTVGGLVDGSWNHRGIFVLFIARLIDTNKCNGEQSLFSTIVRHVKVTVMPDDMVLS